MIRLENKSIAAEFDPRGATLHRLYFGGLCIADKGITVGRYANRIANGEFTLGDKTYRLSVNENQNTLHGGRIGFGQRLWEWEQSPNENTVVFRLVSEDADQGFPGTMQVRVCYTLEGTAVKIEYRAVSDKDTVINLTNHAYFNLNGLDCAPLASEHTLQLNASHYLEVDEALIPTGRLLDVADTRFDFRREKPYDGSFDHNFVLDSVQSDKPAAVLQGCRSGITMQVFTDRPGIQLYNTAEQICLETQNFPDAVHHASFPSPFLRAGETFRAVTVYRFEPKVR